MGGSEWVSYHRVIVIDVVVGSGVGGGSEICFFPESMSDLCGGIHDPTDRKVAKCYCN